MTWFCDKTARGLSCFDFSLRALNDIGFANFEGCFTSGPT